MNDKENILFYVMFVIGFILLFADSSSLMIVILIKIIGIALMVSSAYVININQHYQR